PKAKRARLHAGFAAWLEQFGGSRDDHAALLAHHYAESVRPEDADLVWIGDEDELERLRDKAVGWLQSAAKLAASRYGLREALELAAPKTEARSQALIARGLSTPDAGAEAAAEGLVLAQALGTPRLIVSACEAQALVASTAGRFKQACDWAGRALEALPMVSD